MRSNTHWEKTALPHFSVVFHLNIILSSIPKITTYFIVVDLYALYSLAYISQCEFILVGEIIWTIHRNALTSYKHSSVTLETFHFSRTPNVDILFRMQSCRLGFLKAVIDSLNIQRILKDKIFRDKCIFQAMMLHKKESLFILQDWRMFFTFHSQLPKDNLLAFFLSVL